MAITVCVSSAQTNAKLTAKTVVWAPPSIDWPETLPPASAPKEMIGKLRVAKMPIILEETELESAHRRFGGTLGARGDAGDAEAWLCIHGTDANGPWIFWLTSGEIDGSMIGGFLWMRLAENEVADGRCVPLRKGDGGIELPVPLHLGMTEAQVRGVLGRPTAVWRNTLIFLHQHQEVIDKEDYTSSNVVGIVWRSGVVWEIDVGKTTSD